MDAQSVKGADTVETATRAYDAGKKVNGRKRHIVTDTLGLLIVVLVPTASGCSAEGETTSRVGDDDSATHRPPINMFV